MIRELRQVKGLIEERFGALAFMEKLQRQPAQARLTQRCSMPVFSPALIRKLAEAMPHEVSDEMSWAASVLERNILTGEVDGALEDQGGVYAMVGATGVGKTTSTAKIAAAFAAKYGAGNLGLITLDAYRLAPTSSCAPTAASSACRCTPRTTAPRWKTCSSCWRARRWC